MQKLALDSKTCADGLHALLSRIEKRTLGAASLEEAQSLANQGASEVTDYINRTKSHITRNIPNKK